MQSIYNRPEVADCSWGDGSPTGEWAHLPSACAASMTSTASPTPAPPTRWRLRDANTMWQLGAARLPTCRTRPLPVDLNTGETRTPWPSACPENSISSFDGVYLDRSDSDVSGMGASDSCLHDSAAPNRSFH